ncbi:MAG: hypothetical protein WBM47_19885, partial [Polyangiales bacterium]
MEGLVLRKTATEHVALSAQLVDLPLERGDPLFGAAPKLVESMDVTLSPPLSESRCQCATKRGAETTELVELGSRKGFGPLRERQEKDPFEVVQMHTWKNGADRTTLHE